MTDPTEPARQFAKRVVEEYERFAAESDQLDRAFLSGRVGQLISRWQKQFQPQEQINEHDKPESDAGSADLEGGSGEQPLETETG